MISLRDINYIHDKVKELPANTTKVFIVGSQNPSVALINKLIHMGYCVEFKQLEDEKFNDTLGIDIVSMEEFLKYDTDLNEILIPKLKSTKYTSSVGYFDKYLK